MSTQLDDKPGTSQESDLNDLDFDTPATRGLEDQLGALERDKLNGLEQNAANPKDDTANENLMNYMHMADKPSGNKFKSWFGRNKIAIAGGGGTIVLLGGLFTFVAPLKLQGILSQIEGVGMGRIESYVERRTQKLVFQAVFNNTIGDRNLVKGGSLMERIGKTMASNKYEQRLAAKGLEFVKDGKSVRVRLTGTNMEEAQKLLNKAFANADDLENALDGIPATRKVIKAIVKEDLGVWGFLVRGKLTKWMMSYLGIKRFGTGQVDSAATADDKARNVATSQATDGLEARATAIENGIDVIDNAESLGTSGTPATAAEKASAKQSMREAITGSIDDLTKSISKASSSAIAKAVEAAAEKLGVKLAEGLASKIGSKAIPVYGEVTAAAMAIVFVHWLQNNYNNGNAARALAMPAAMLMGFSYGQWEGYASQAKEGTLDTDLYNYFTPFLDGVETSALFNCTNKDWQSGCDSVGTEPYKRLNQTNESMPIFLQGISATASTLGIAASDYSPLYWLARIIYNLDDAIVGGAISIATESYLNVLKTYISIEANLAGLLMGEDVKKQIEQGVDNMISQMGQLAMNGVLTIFGLDISSTMGGNKLFDILLNGSVFTANRYGETSLGLHQIDPSVASAQTQQYLAEQREYDKSKGVLYALFSPDSTNSVTSQLVSRTTLGGGAGNTVSNIVASLFGLVETTPSSLADIVSNKTTAASYGSPESILSAIPYGMTDAEVAAPINEAVSSGQACPTSSSAVDSIADWFAFDTSSGKTFDNCQIDTIAAQSVLCALDNSITETAECNPDAGGAAAIGTPSGSCPDGTSTVNGITNGWDRSGNQKSIALCSIPGTDMSTIPHWTDSRYQGTSAAGVKEIAVNSEAASSLLQASQLAQKEGVKLSASVGYRSLYEQCSIVMKPGNLGKLPSVCPSWVTAVPGNWSSTVTYSNHMMGYSIDFYQSSEDWMRKCEKNNLDGTSDGKCYGFIDDVYQSEGWDSAHFTYKP